MQFLKLFVISFIVMLCLDMLWLGVIAKPLYQQSLGLMLRQSNGQFTPIWAAGIVVYVLLVLGILCFVLPKVGGNYLLALGWGGFLGLIVYGVYDFTNYAILANWPLSITLIDCLWGIIVSAITTVAATAVQHI